MQSPSNDKQRRVGGPVTAPHGLGNESRSRPLDPAPTTPLLRRDSPGRDAPGPSEGGFLRSVLVVTWGTAAGQAVLIATAPILTRLYGPGEFGILAVYAAILGVIAIVASLSYELAIPLPRSDRQAAAVLGVSVVSALLVTALSAIVIAALGPHLGRWIGTPELARYAWWIPVGVLLAATYQAWNYWAIRTGAFSLIAATKLRQGFGSASVQLGMGTFGAGPIGLIVGHIVGQAAGVLLLIKGAASRAPRLTSRVTLAKLRWAARRYRRFPTLYSWSGLANAVGIRSPVILFAALHGPGAAGTLLLAEQVVGMPMKLVGTAVGQVYFGKAAALARSHRRAFRRFFRRLTLALFLLGTLGATAVALGGPSLFRIVLGEQWGDVGLFVRILALMYVVQFTAGPVSQTLAILEMQGVKLAWEVIRLGAVTGAFALAWLWELDPPRTLATYGGLSATSLLLLLFVTDRAIPRERQ